VLEGAEGAGVLAVLVLTVVGVLTVLVPAVLGC